MNHHLIKAVEILKERYKGAIYDDGDWSYNLMNWTIQISTQDDKFYDVVAYRVKDNSTDWSNYTVLPSYPVQFELVGA
jgi:hypothetical protein